MKFYRNLGMYGLIPGAVGAIVLLCLKFFTEMPIWMIATISIIVYFILRLIFALIPKSED